MTAAILFIYLADVATKLTVFLSVVSIVAGTFGGIRWAYGESEDVPSACREGIRCIAASIVVGLLVAAVPSKTTMYVAAGASATSAAIESPIGQKVIAALETVIDDAAKGSKK